MFDALYSFVLQQGQAMFRTLKAETSRVIAAALRLCSYYSPVIRGEARAFLYFMILQNLKQVGTFDVVKNAAILACSRLAEDHKDFGGSALKNALSTISEYALQDLFAPPARTERRVRGSVFTTTSSLRKASASASRLSSKCRSFCSALSKIVRDTQEIVNSRGSSDVEKVAEQYYRISEGYRNSPELRLEWLEKLAQFHAKNGDFPEAALAMTHVLALLSDYLNNCTDMRVDTSVFKRINPSICRVLF